jgi:hypothetical protein
MLGESDWTTVRTRLAVLPAFTLAWQTYTGGTWPIERGDTTVRIPAGGSVPQHGAFWNRRQVVALAADPDYRPTPVSEETLRELERRHGVPPDVLRRYMQHGRLPDDEALIVDALAAYLQTPGA